MTPGRRGSGASSPRPGADDDHERVRTTAVAYRETRTWRPGARSRARSPCLAALKPHVRIGDRVQQSAGGAAGQDAALRLRCVRRRAGRLRSRWGSPNPIRRSSRTRSRHSSCEAGGRRDGRRFVAGRHRRRARRRDSRYLVQPLAPAGARRVRRRARSRVARTRWTRIMHAIFPDCAAPSDLGIRLRCASA